ncbi:MAG: gliding motility-associated protein GldE [Bacteroidetes bacterium]|nr:gliding motility-associated protein GldE [Bacteroidota bacterium]
MSEINTFALEIVHIESVLIIALVLISAIIKTFTIGIFIGILLIFLLLIVSALVSGSENAFFSLTPSEIDEYRGSSEAKHQLIIHLLERPKKLLATVLITNNFVNTSVVIISTYIVANLFDFTSFPVLGMLIQVVVITSLILFLGEILPKVYATQNAKKIVLFMASPLHFLSRVFSPLIYVLVKSSSLIDKRITKKGHNISISELSDVIDITSGTSTPQHETQILRGIVNFGDIDVKEIMKSRIDVVAIDSQCMYSNLLKIVLDTGYSRMPVYTENFDRIDGILYIKDLLPHLNKDNSFNWMKLIRPAFFVPENKKINDLLKEFQEKKIHLAIVVDEYGGTSGIVTLEDILEEIVGEINDEFDIAAEGVDYTKIDEKNYMFEGKTTLNDFYKILGLEEKVFDEIKGESDTIAGLILENQGKIPEKNTVIQLDNFTFRIEAVDNRRIKRIKVTVN